ncbi:MAG TPA: Ig-like domain-containing protein [Methylomirabilota bacterium]|nr:Ig-like domain-containing protein [Methylomirabilota bacterium]
MSLWQGRRAVLFVPLLLLLAAGPALAAGVHAQFDPSSPAGMPFPTDLLAVADAGQNTGLRVSLPKPDCSARPTDCADIDVINTLDGFNLQPRISIPFSGPIDVSTVSSSTVFFLSRGDTLGGGGGQVVGINQVVWDPATNTLHAESDQLLDQHTRYALIVTNGITDTAGNPVGPSPFRQALSFGQTKSATLKAYRKALLDAIDASGVDPDRVVVASLFTTQSATAVLEKIRDSLKAATPAPATILADFPRANVVAIQWKRQVLANGSTTSSFLPLPALDIFPGSVGRIVFGSFSSPDWETAAKVIPAIGTRTGVPVAQGANTLYFNLFVPSGTPPAAGWPVAIFGHGFTDSKQGAPIAVASTLASHGIASIAINVVGHGGGAGGTLTIIPAVGTPVTIPDGGRGIDQDGNGTIDSTEGSSAVGANAIVGNRDGLRQTVADLMQLVRVLQVGVSGLDAGHIYYAGQSFGGIYGTKFIALEPDVRAGVPNVPGGAIIEIARLSPNFRALVGFSLLTRVPSLCNAGAFVPPLWCFQESIPLRDDPAIVSPAPGAMPIQDVIDNTEWVSQAGNPVAYAPHLRKVPLDGVPTRPFIIQSAKSDQTVPNPTASAIVRAGDAHDRWTLVRWDLVRATRPTAPANPHTFLTNIGNPVVADIAIEAQQQIAIFFGTDGAVVVDPDTALGPFFEVPISAGQIPLMEDLNF